MSDDLKVPRYRNNWEECELYKCADIDPLLAELARLREALPRTADGVTIVPRVRVWWEHEEDGYITCIVVSVGVPGILCEDIEAGFDFGDDAEQFHHRHPETGKTVEEWEREQEKGADHAR